MYFLSKNLDYSYDSLREVDINISGSGDTSYAKDNKQDFFILFSN